MGRLKLRGKNLLVRGTANVSNDVEIVNDFGYGTGVESGVIHSVATGSTTDATALKVAEISLSPNDFCLIKMIAFGKEADGGKDVGTFGKVATVNRDGDGNVTLKLNNVALFTENNTDSWGGVAVAVNTTNQTAEIKVTGKATTNIKWFVQYEYVIMNHSAE